MICFLLEWSVSFYGVFPSMICFLLRSIFYGLFPSMVCYDLFPSMVCFLLWSVSFYGL